MVNLFPADGLVPENVRNEYGQHYRQLAANHVKASFPVQILNEFEPLLTNAKMCGCREVKDCNFQSR
jgi:hypothetical protein